MCPYPARSLRRTLTSLRRHGIGELCATDQLRKKGGSQWGDSTKGLSLNPKTSEPAPSTLPKLPTYASTRRREPLGSLDLDHAVLDLK